MRADRAAIIDIGSNSIRYMEAEHGHTGLVFSRKEVFTTRLAEGLLASGNLSEARMEQSLGVLSALAARAHAGGFVACPYATSAVRDAENRDAFLARVASQTGMPIRVLSGEEEAHFAYAGASNGQGGLIDIGGGSTQVMDSTFRRSFPLGCVRVKDLCGGIAYPDMRRRMQGLFETTYHLPPFPRMRWTAVGGTATTLAALHLNLTTYDPQAVGCCEMEASEVNALLQRLDAMSDEARRKHPLLSQRHDVILCGGTILVYLLERLEIDRVSFSDADGMEGYAASLLVRCNS